MTDLLWDIATAPPVLIAVASLLAAALVVGYFPLLRWFPVLGQYVAVARLASYLFLALLTFLLGFRVADNRAEAAALRSKLEAAEVDRDAANQSAERLERDRQELARAAGEDQRRIATYEEALKARPNTACTLTDDDFPRRLRQ